MEEKKGGKEMRGEGMEAEQGRKKWDGEGERG